MTVWCDVKVTYKCLLSVHKQWNVNMEIEWERDDTYDKDGYWTDKVGDFGLIDMSKFSKILLIFAKNMLMAYDNKS